MYDVNCEIEDLEYLFENGDYELCFNLRCNHTLYERVYREEYLEYFDCYKDYVLDISILGDECEGKVGEIAFKLFDITLIDNIGTDRLDFLDSIDSDTYELGLVLDREEKVNEAYESSSYLLFIENMFINKLVRNKGIAHRVLMNFEKIVNWYLNFTPGIIIFKSFPIEYKIEHSLKERETEEYENGFNILNDKLNRLYRECGFEEIELLNYFYKIL